MPKPSRGMLDAEPIVQLVDVDLAAEDEHAVAFVQHRLGLDVVLVANLADDLLEQVLDRDQARGAAVLVDDDRRLHLLALELLQQVGHPLGLGHEVAPAAAAWARRCSLGLRVGQPDQVLDEDEARGCDRACPCRPARASTAARRTPAAARPASRRAARPTMSGRGVMTSRTERVAEVDDRLRCSRRSSRSIRPSCSPASRYACAASPSVVLVLRRAGIGATAPCAARGAASR